MTRNSLAATFTAAALLAASLPAVLIGCAGLPPAGDSRPPGEDRAATIQGVDALVEATARGVLERLPAADPGGDARTLAVYYFTAGGEVSGISDYLMNGLTTSLASRADARLRVVSRQVLDRLLAETSFQMSDLADKESQIRLGRQLGADLILTGFITPVEEHFKLNVQLVEVETGVVLTGLLLDFQVEAQFASGLVPQASETVLVRREKVEVTGAATVTTLLEDFDHGAPEIQMDHAEDHWGDRVRSADGEITIEPGASPIGSLDGSAFARFDFQATLDSPEVLGRWQEADMYFVARLRPAEKAGGYDGLNLAMKTEGYTLLHVGLHQESAGETRSFYLELTLPDGQWRELKLPFSHFHPDEPGWQLDLRKPLIVAISVPFLENWLRHSFRTGTQVQAALSIDNVGFYRLKQAPDRRVIETFDDEIENLPWVAEIYGASVYTDWSDGDSGEEKTNPGVRAHTLALSRTEGGATPGGRHLNLAASLELTGRIGEYHQDEQTLTVFLKSPLVEDLKGFEGLSFYVRSDLATAGTLELQDEAGDRYYNCEFAVTGFWTRVRTPFSELRDERGSLAEALKRGRWPDAAKLQMSFHLSPQKLEQAGARALAFEVGLDDFLLED